MQCIVNRPHQKIVYVIVCMCVDVPAKAKNKQRLVNVPQTNMENLLNLVWWLIMFFSLDSILIFLIF